MRIVIDLQGAQTESRFRGIGRYSLSLALAIARNAGEHEIWLALNAAFPESILNIREAFKDLISHDRIRVFQVPTHVAEFDISNAWRVRTAELIREYFIEQLNPDIVLVTSLFEGYVDDAVTSVGRFSPTTKTAIILYDLIPYLTPEKYLPTKIQQDYYARKIESLKNADLLLSISESTRQEGIKALSLSEKQIFNISTAVDESFRPIKLSEEEIQKLSQKYGITRKILMYAPGGFDERKNFDGLIKAYSLLPQELREKYQLVVVGRVFDDYRYGVIKLAKYAQLAQDELIITGYVSDDDLIALYNLATLFIYPSKHEGFGLPALEAMACGTPTIGSNTTSVPEVIGWDEALFDPYSAESISQKMQQALEDETFRGELKKHAIKQVSVFSWDNSAKLALNILTTYQINNVDKQSIQQPSNIADVIQSIVTISSTVTDQDLIVTASSMAFNSNASNSKQLLIDISVIVHGDAKSGIQRVVRSILLEILKNPPQHINVNPIYFDGQLYRYAMNFTAKIMNKSAEEMIDEPVEFNQGDIYLALDLNAHLTKAVHDLHKYLQCIGVEMYFIVYDILLVQHPEWWVEGTSTIFEEWLKSIAETSTGLICISESVAIEVREWLIHNPPNRLSLPGVMSFHLGADLDNSAPSKGIPVNAEFVLNQLTSKPSFLSVGTVEPRKGLKQTLLAFEQLWAEGMDINLVIVGKQGWLVDELVERIRNHPELNKRLFWLEGISDEYLEKVYIASTCLIAASEGEGFGLPLIEAAQHKLPIIARDIPVFREVAGEYAYYFANDHDPSVLVNTITSWLELYNENNHPKSDKMPWLTWKKSATQIIKLMNIENFKLQGQK